MMVKNLKWLEKAASTSILITLFQHEDEEMYLSELKKETKANTSSIYGRIGKDEMIGDLEKAGLIKKRVSPTVKNDIPMGGKTVWISLTPKGKKVAKKLLEIKKIMEEE